MYSDAGSLQLGLSPWFICTELATCTQHVAHNINHAPGDQRIMLPAVLIPHALTQFMADSTNQQRSAIIIYVLDLPVPIYVAVRSASQDHTKWLPLTFLAAGPERLTW